MTRFTVEVLPEAEADFEKRSSGTSSAAQYLADAFRTDVLENIDGLQGDADMLPKDEDGIHFRILSRRFKYTVHYDLVGTLATVIAVAAQRRQPGYWSGRGSREGA